MTIALKVIKNKLTVVRPSPVWLVVGGGVLLSPESII